MTATSGPSLAVLNRRLPDPSALVFPEPGSERRGVLSDAAVSGGARSASLAYGTVRAHPSVACAGEPDEGGDHALNRKPPRSFFALLLCVLSQRSGVKAYAPVHPTAVL